MQPIEYCPIQQQQIMQQHCADTQRVKVAIWTANRTSLFHRDLNTQIHRNFTLVSRVEELENLSFDCLLVVSEDASMMSTTLGCFADAIAKGADFCYSDCCFGIGGETRCYYSPKKYKQHQLKLAGISAARFRSLILPEQTAPAQIIAAAQAAAEKPEHIPYLLSWYHRPIQVEDLFSADSRRALLFTHEYSMSGAPLVLLGAVPELEKQGFMLAAIGPEEDKLLSQYQDSGVTAVVDGGAVKDSSLTHLALGCDLALANTIIEYPVVTELSRFQVPTLWWIHDAKAVYPHLTRKLPQKLSQQVKVCCVSEYARSVFLKYCPEAQSGTLMYALEDAAGKPSEAFPVPHEGKTLFTTVGSLENRKGQEVLCQMIDRMPADLRSKCLFLIVGRVIDKRIGDLVEQLAKRYPENVRYENFVPRSHINSVFRQTDCILCPSKDDPLPTFVTEGWMLGVPCICSENTGSAALIQDGVNSFLYRGDDPDQLLSKVRAVLELEEGERKQMGSAARAIYEANFTMECFCQNIHSIVNTVCGTKV